ncbi:MAG: CinA family protein [Anaplasma sp.]
MVTLSTLIKKATACIRYLREQNMKIACAESCTGGLLSFALSGVPGASEVLFCSMVTYATSSKTMLLGIPKQEIEKYGVVSGEIARMMAEGALETLTNYIDLAVSITGTAGSITDAESYAHSENDDGTVGTVYIGLAKAGAKTLVLPHHFGNLPRHRIQEMAAERALDLIYTTAIQHSAKGEGPQAAP